MTVTIRKRVVRLAAVAILLAVTAGAQQIQVRDQALGLRSQDIYDMHLQRGRASIAADFNLDGNVDFFIGNPGDTSLIMESVAMKGRVRFEVAQVLLVEELAWGGAAFDYDNDGDYDLFISIGGNEGIGFDYMFRNLWMETGRLHFEDVTAEAGVAGPIPPGETDPITVASANAITSDYDRDGDIDLFVNVNIQSKSPPQIKGRNILWRNNGDGTFTDVTDVVGLGASQEKTRHSTFLDVDNDGDVDLFENNLGGPNLLHRNLLVETGSALFEDATDEFSPPGEDLHFPHGSFASATADFNNDGWDDLVLFARSPEEGESGSPYLAGHLLFLNQAGEGFVNVAEVVGLNDSYFNFQGVMGCQVGDINFDGIPDIYIGTGAPENGNFNQLYVSQSGTDEQLDYADRSDLIDFESPQWTNISYPPYPYRTHGISIVDVDGDGGPEIAVLNGGPARHPDDVQEPNRLFKLAVSGEPHYLQVRPVGDGVHVSRDAIGARVAVEVSNAAGDSWTVYRTLLGGNGFSAQNGFNLFFGLRNAVSVNRVTVTWPDGAVKILEGGVVLDSKIVVSY